MTDDLEYFELAAHLTDMPEKDLHDMDYQVLDELLCNKYDISFEQFIDIVKDLIPMVTVAKSILTDTTYKGFSKDGLWFLKQPL